jgi:hypothetical protein
MLRSMVTARLKHSFSKQHLAAADYFADQAERIEIAAHSKAEQADPIAHRAYVTGSIVSAAAALESSINELFLEAADRNPHTVRGLAPEVLARMEGLWLRIERKPLLEKYQIALILADKPRLDEGRTTFEDAASLCNLRNALVHYKPEWDDETEVHRRLQRRLNSKFDLNPLAPKGSLWFPHVCLGSGCAKWCVQVVRTFAADFCESLGVPKRL